MDISLESPLPADYESAIKEIRRLRNQLYQTNLKWSNAIYLRELDRKSLMGTIRALHEEINQLKKRITS